MSEKPPTSPNTPDNNPPNNPEIGPISAPTDGRVQRTSSCIEPGVVDSFMEMTERGKAIIGDAYEKLYDVPVVNRIVGKIGIAYKSFWVDGHEKKAAGKKTKMDRIDVSMLALDKASQDLSAVIDNLKQQHAPGSEALQLKLKVIEKQKAELQNEKDKAQTELEEQDNQVRRFTNGRDAIADGLIDRYEEKLAPLESGLDSLQHSREHISMEFTAADMRNRETMKTISEMEQRRTKIVEAFRLMGSSERAIRRDKSVSDLNGEISSMRTGMRIEKERLTKRRNDIENRIIKADKKANPYRDKRAEFVRAKQGRPIDMGVETRSKERNVEAHENAQSHTRNEQPVPESVSENVPENVPENVQESVQESVPETTPDDSPLETAEKTSIEKSETLPSVSLYVSGWNKFLQDKYGKDSSPAPVDMADFLEETGLKGVGVVDKADFSNVLGKYYAYKRVSMPSFKEDMGDFLKDYAPK